MFMAQIYCEFCVDSPFGLSGNDILISSKWTNASDGRTSMQDLTARQLGRAPSNWGGAPIVDTGPSQMEEYGRR